MTRILIINNAEAGIRDFSAPIENIVTSTGEKFKSIEYAECKTFDFSPFDGIILTGSPQGDDIVEHHLPFFQWVKDLDKPVLGICAGHHVTAYMYGAQLFRSEEPESGAFEVNIIQDDPLFKDLPKSFIVKQMHNDSVTVPGEFELLATATTCRNQVMKHKSKPLYTCQFHPEFYNHDLIRNFIALCE